MLTIHRFFALLFFLIVGGLYTSFAAFYFHEQKAKSEIIAADFQRTLNEIGYQIYSGVSSFAELEEMRAGIQRKAAQNNLIDDISIQYGNKTILSTDPKMFNHSHQQLDEIDVLLESEHLRVYRDIHADVMFYDGVKPINLRIILSPNGDELDRRFDEIINSYINYSLLPTLIIAVLLFLLIKKRLIAPLEKLRQFAYYHNHVPNQFKIRELESIRNSMQQTFKRLNEEAEALYNSARTDDLSGLPNRQQLTERLNWLISESSRTQEEFAYLFIDLDNFKHINDTLGHDTGDELLIEISRIMQAELRGHDIIARFGGDEFVMVLNKYRNHLELNHIIERVLRELQEIDSISNQTVSVSASIGVAFYPKDGKNAQTLMKHADIAMYQAKERGKNQVHYFTEELNQKILQHVTLEQDLRSGIKNKEFELYYQPKVKVETGEISGCECLIRWHHPTRGLIPPNQFIPLAENSGLIVQLGEWVLEEAIQQQLFWKKMYGIDLPISVNVSAHQFAHENFYTRLQQIFKDFEFEPNKLDIEVTESVLLDDSNHNLSILKMIRSLGVTTSLDDFGTGYSSLAYLKRFPINVLKIDKSFMDDYLSRTGSVFIQTIITMAHNLNIEIVAEGIEQQDQLNYLKSVDCEFYQGYFCSKPLPAKNFIELVQDSLNKQAKT
ncbi:putative bifunctional diguanylate cyclase/phosphodiesterase [Thiomicrorhabdus sediminis]|uniref:cyclic-guanylate-specific phosphodiesterase n=1 Tax=Thiomicrorhabdus sediminis TaxID=2580412 RepID=A0A4P9K4Q8_9GAMM|nr:EAL domain-containing protein [Thiomicrorhabdus sediminis]QCU89196.1 EAL domain-containing protein [Thiomicrorhabdus sediminis]